MLRIALLLRETLLLAVTRLAVTRLAVARLLRVSLLLTVTRLALAVLLLAVPLLPARTPLAGILPVALAGILPVATLTPLLGAPTLPAPWMLAHCVALPVSDARRRGGSPPSFRRTCLSQT